jgi:hypothetical protein
MKKRKFKFKTKRRRNQSAGAVALAPRRPRLPPRAAPPSFQTIASAAAGAVGSAVVTGLLVNQKIAKPETVALLLAATGGLGAYLTDRNARVAFTGAAAAGAGQFALAYLGKSATKRNEMERTVAAAPAEPPPSDAPRKSAYGGSYVVDTFHGARADLDEIEDEWRYEMRDADPVDDGYLEIDLDEAA